MYMKTLAAVAALALGVGTAQAATPVQVTFSGSGPLGFNAYGPSVYFPQQNALIDALSSNPSFNFTFEYDPDTAMVGGKFAATLISGQAGSIGNFSDYQAFIQGGGGTTLAFFLYRLDFENTAAFLTYTSIISFTLVDNQGGLTAGGGSLPTTIDPASLEQKNAEFRITRAGGVGQGYRYLSGGMSVAVGASPTGPVPEPAAWALMLAGFGAVGGAMRRKRHRAMNYRFA